MKIRKKILTLCLSLSTILSIFATASQANTKNTIRVSGYNRSETSFKTSKINMDNFHNKNIVIADGYNFADALSAMNIANKFNASLLLDSNYPVNDTLVEHYMDSAQAKNIFLIGGKECKKYTKSKYNNTNIIHIYGKDRYETNEKSLKISGYKDIGVASGENYADALSSYSLLRKTNIGLKLVKPNSDYKLNGYRVRYTFGGKQSVRKDGGERIAGSNRYETSAKIAEKTNYQNVAFVSGNSFADALSAINLVNDNNTNILLTPTDGNKLISSLANRANIIYIVSGEKTLPSKNVESAISGNALKKPSPQSIAVKNNIVVPGTNGKVRINLPTNVASRIEYDSSGKYIINKNVYKKTGDLDCSTVILVALQPYVGTNKHHHNFAESNTYGTFKKNGKKYSLCGDYSFTSFRYDAYDVLSQSDIDEMYVDLRAILFALESNNTTGLIH